MTTNLQTLLAEKARIEAEITAAKPSAVAAVRSLMEQLGVTLADLGAQPIAASRPVTKRAVKYRDDQGNTWTGVGQRPKWLQARLAGGATIEQFSVKRAG